MNPGSIFFFSFSVVNQFLTDRATIRSTTKAEKEKPKVHFVHSPLPLFLSTQHLPYRSGFRLCFVITQNENRRHGPTRTSGFLFLANSY